MKRALVLAASIVALAAVAITYAVLAAADPSPAGAALDTTRSGQLLFLDAGARVAAVPSDDPGAARTVGDLSCRRFHSSGGTAVCLTAEVRGGLPRTSALILDSELRETNRLNLAGVPSRARVSPSGRMVAWTVFVTGESYNATGFSTWTGILDTRTGYPIVNIETIPLYIDGRRHHAADVNFWGVTFAADDNRFYATVSTQGRTYLVEGDYAKWEARTLRGNVECPSLSPDGTRLAFKKRVSPSAAEPWRLHVLDLVTMREAPLAETASVDDQAQWLSDSEVAYARPGAAGSSDIWAVPADGSGNPRLLVPAASSPSMPIRVDGP
ncbi:TolB family protein [Micromonospora sp. CA-111912]|uniref:TolB family protein n=1 Tax=Micromonospora sp. CA-111912 TaxID=3239955 RepID=UPI003D8F0C65